MGVEATAIQKGAAACLGLQWALPEPVPVAASLSWSEPARQGPQHTVWASPGPAFRPPSGITKHFVTAGHKSMSSRAKAAAKPHDDVRLPFSCLKKKSPSKKNITDIYDLLTEKITNSY